MRRDDASGARSKLFPSELFTPTVESACLSASCGSEAFSIDLGFSRFDFVGVSEAQQALACREIPGATPGRAVGSGGVRPLVTRIRRLTPACFREFDMRGWRTKIHVTATPASICTASLYFAARVPRQGRRRAVVWTLPERVDTFPGVVENYLRVVASFEALGRSALVLHSAAIARDGRAHLFVGRSGAGKSTMARLCRTAGWQVISDDLNIISRDGDSYRVVRVPFGGDLRPDWRAEPLPVLTSIDFLHKAKRPNRRIAGHAHSLASLVACCPFASQDPDAFEGIAGRAGDVVDRVQTYDLSFRLRELPRAFELKAARHAQG